MYLRTLVACAVMGVTVFHSPNVGIDRTGLRQLYSMEVSWRGYDRGRQGDGTGYRPDDTGQQSGLFRPSGSTQGLCYARPTLPAKSTKRQNRCRAA